MTTDWRRSNFSERDLIIEVAPGDESYAIYRLADDPDESRWLHLKPSKTYSEEAEQVEQWKERIADKSDTTPN